MNARHPAAAFTDRGSAAPRRPRGGRERTQLRAACGFAADECEAVLNRCLERGWVIEADGRLLSLVLDRAERQRVVDRRVELQLQSFGLSLSDAEPLAAMPL